MHIVDHAHLARLQRPGQSEVTVAGRELGVGGFQVRLHTLEPGAQTESLSHDGELVVLALGGQGKLLIDGGPQRFGGACTLLVPPRQPFAIANRGTAPLELVVVCTAAPVPADGGDAGSGR